MSRASTDRVADIFHAIDRCEQYRAHFRVDRGLILDILDHHLDPLATTLRERVEP